MNKFSLVFVAGGAIALAFSLVLGWLGYPHVIKSQIRKSAKLVKGSTTYNLWKGPTPIPVYLKFFLFNVTNPDEIQNGEKAKVNEIGPYTYLQKKEKVEIGPGKRNHTLQYRTLHWVYFMPQMSIGSETDMITFINIPYVSLAKIASHSQESGEIHKLLETKLKESAEGLFKTTSVRELLYDGYSIETYLNIIDDPIMTKYETFRAPEHFLNGKFAIYEGKNGSDDGIYEVNTGMSDYKDFGVVQAWNNRTLLPWWKHDHCNFLNGTDGTIFPPFITKNTSLRTFASETCRRMDIIFEKETEFKGVPGYRFTMDPKTLLGPHHNTENWCFCVDPDPKACERDGLILLAGCSEGVPLALSFPHFYKGDPSLVENIDGMIPLEEKHKTFIDIEPETASTLVSAKRFQMNIELNRHEHIEIFSKVREATFPIFWTEETVELPDDYLVHFGRMQMLTEFVNQAKWILIVVSFCSVFAGVLVGMIKRDKIEVIK